MLPTQQSKLTLSILDRLKKKGMPGPTVTQSLDPDTFNLDIAEEGEEEVDSDTLEPLPLEEQVISNPTPKRKRLPVTGA